MCSRFLQEVKPDFDEVHHVDGQLDPLEVLLVGLFAFAVVSLRVTGLIDIREHHDEGGDEQVVDCQNGNEEVPNLAECSFSVNQIPFEFGLAVDDLVFVIGVFIDVINHHFLQIRLCHLLKSGLESQFVIVPPRLSPQLGDPFLFLGRRHGAPLVLSVVAGGVVL